MTVLAPLAIGIVLLVALVIVMSVSLQSSPGGRLLQGHDGVTLVTVSVVSLVTMAIVLAFARWIVVSLRALTAAAERVDKWQRGTVFPRLSGNEMEDVTAGLNRMLAHQRERQDVLESAAAAGERRLRLIQNVGRVRDSLELDADLGNLLDSLVEVIQKGSGCQHVSMYLMDRSREWVVLHAAVGTESCPLLPIGHRVRVGAIGIIGQVALEGRLRSVRRTIDPAGGEADEARAEERVAVPMLSRGGLLGVLDLQGSETMAMDDLDLSSLQMVADQAASAISTLQLLSEMRQNLKVAQRVQGEATRREWIDRLRHRPRRGYYVDAIGTVPLSERPASDERADLAALRVPIEVRGQRIGVIQARKPRDAGRWTVSEISLMETLTGQLIVALDSARLYEDAQLRAVGDRTIGELTAHMGRTLDVEMVLRTAAQDLRDTLGLLSVSVHLTAPLGGGAGVERGRVEREQG